MEGSRVGSGDGSGVKTEGDNGDGAGNVATAVAPAEQTSTSSANLKQREESQEKRKRIDQLVTELFQQVGQLAENNPNEAYRLYKEAEYCALSEGKNAVGKTYVWVMHKLNLTNFETELKKEKKKLESITSTYKGTVAQLETDMDKMAKKVNELKSRKDKSYELVDLINSEIEDEQGKLVDMNDKYQNLKGGQYTKEAINEMRKQRDEARKTKSYTQKLEERKVENAILLQNTEKELEEAQQQQDSLRDQMDKTKMEMYAVMQDQTPTTYLMYNIGAMRKAYLTFGKANGIRQRIRGITTAAKGANAGLESASYKQSFGSDEGEQDEQHSDMLKQRDEIRKQFATQRKDIVDRAEQSRRVDRENDSLI